MIFARLISPAICLLLVPALPAAAQGEGGLVTLNIDGESFEFPLEASQSDWFGKENFGSLSIYARPLDAATWERFKTLTLAFEYATGVYSSPEASLTEMIEGESVKFYADEDQTEIDLTVDSLTVEGELLTVSGAITMTMGPSDDFGHTIATDDLLPASGTFTVTLGPV